MLRIAAGLLVLLLAAVLVVAATRPDNFSVRRAASIEAPPEKIFPLINDFTRWNAWSPYEKKDPAMKRSFSGPAAGKGAVYAWQGNGDVGQGRMEIADAVAPARVTLKLDFVKPFEAHNKVDFTLEPKGGATEVTWAMDGPMPFISKVVTLFVDMDRMVGGDFEAGLANLKAIAEK
ncbi:MAG TPA: SRPBCC family protein [Burkholderiales bacterium]|nr:SRPBCC family protein [Burkholderiales bacterium]